MFATTLLDKGNEIVGGKDIGFLLLLPDARHESLELFLNSWVVGCQALRESLGSVQAQIAGGL